MEHLTTDAACRFEPRSPPTAGTCAEAKPALSEVLSLAKDEVEGRPSCERRHSNNHHDVPAPLGPSPPKNRTKKLSERQASGAARHGDSRGGRETQLPASPPKRAVESTPTPPR